MSASDQDAKLCPWCYLKLYWKTGLLYCKDKDCDYEEKVK